MDELTSPVSSEPASPSPSPESGQATETSGATETTPQQSQPQTSQPRINLFESPEFRQFQASQQRQIAEYQRQAQEYQQQLHAARMEQMDDLEKANYTADQYRGAYEQMQQQVERQQLEYQRWQTLQELSVKTGVPVEKLSVAATPKDAYELAIAEMKAQTETIANTRAAELAKRQEANRPDIGGGSLANASESGLAQAASAGDVTAYIRQLRISSGG